MGGKREVIAFIAGQPISPNMEIVLHNLGRLLSDTFDLHLIVAKADLPDRLAAYYTAFDVPTYRWDIASFRYAYQGCGIYLEHNQPDILLNVAQSTLGWAVALWGRRVNVPTLVRVTGDPREAGLGRSPWERLKSHTIHGDVLLAACRRATRVLTLGSRVRAKLGDLGVSTDKISVLPQPFDPQPFRPVGGNQQSDVKQRLGLRPDRQTLLFVGRLSWLKGADRSLAIMDQIHAEKLPFQLCLVGNGEYEERFRKYPDELVHMAGKVSPEDIPAYYRAADMLIFPSRTEGLPNVILEALAAELPIIASPVGEIPDYVSRTATQPSEFLAWLRTVDWSPDPLPDYFDWEHQRAAYRELFASVIQGHRPGAT